MTAVANRMVKIMAKNLGAKYKFKLSNGCMGIGQALPKPRNTLGLVRCSIYHFQRYTYMSPE